MMSLFSLLGTKFAISFILDSLRPSPHSLRAEEARPFVRRVWTHEDRSAAEGVRLFHIIVLASKPSSSSSEHPAKDLLHRVRVCRRYSNRDQTPFPAGFGCICNWQRRVEATPCALTSGRTGLEPQLRSVVWPSESLSFSSTKWGWQVPSRPDVTTGLVCALCVVDSSCSVQN